MKRCGVDEFFGLLGYYTAYADSCLPNRQSSASIHCITTRKNVDLPSTLQWKPQISHKKMYFADIFQLNIPNVITCVQSL